MNTPQTRAQPEEFDEVGSLAVELAYAYEEMTGFYRDKLHMTEHGADQHTRGLDQTPEQAADDLARIRERAPDRVTWFDLQRVLNHDPEVMTALWSQIKAEARDELASGHRTAQALEWKGSPWDRARFLAIRDGFHSSTPPRNGIEAALLDTAAEAFSDYLGWTEHLHMQAGSEVESERHQLEHDGGWNPPGIGMAEAIEQSFKMAERAHARFLKTIKMLYDLHRTSPTVYVGNAGQINVGAQQVNVVNAAQEAKTVGENLPK